MSKPTKIHDPREYYRLVDANFINLALDGDPFTLADARAGYNPPDDYNLRGLASIPLKHQRQGLVVSVGTQRTPDPKGRCLVTLWQASPRVRLSLDLDAAIEGGAD